MNTIQLYGIAFLVFCGLDGVWLGLISKDLYRQQLGYLMTKDVNWAAAVIFYLLFIAGLVFFVIQPAMKLQSWQYALGAGAFFGLVTYATYDLTNLAVVKQWPLFITIVDLAWGTTLSMLVSTVTFFIAQWISK